MALLLVWIPLGLVAELVGGTYPNSMDIRDDGERRKTLRFVTFLLA